jgi:predicted small metal-binding protein
MNQVSCECGYSVRDNNEDRLVELVLVHVQSTHPELTETITPDIVRSWIEIVP